MRKAAIRFGMVFAAVLALVLSLPHCVYRQDFNRALVMWIQQPSAENYARFRNERNANHEMWIAGSIELALVVSGVLNCVHGWAKRLRRSSIGVVR